MRRTKAFSKIGVVLLLCGGFVACDKADSAAKEERGPAQAWSAEAEEAPPRGAKGVQAKLDNSDDMPSRYGAASKDAAEADEAMPADGAQLEAEPVPEPEAVAAIEETKPSGSRKKGALGGMDKSAIGGAVSGKAKIAKPGRPNRRPEFKSKQKPDPKPDVDNEEYDHIKENEFIAVKDDPRSTFSIDVDTASFSNVRRHIEDGHLPPPEAVRIEELINYFSYNYESPIGSDPFTVNTEVSGTPWNKDTLLVSVGLQGQRIDMSEVPGRNLVFLLDVSGSMNSQDKLPLLKKALGMLVNNLRDEDRVSIVVYAGASGVVLEPTMGNDKPRIMEALGRLEAGGGTNGGEGIQLAYRMAQKDFVKGGINRVILATDGDFNVGISNRTELMDLIEEKRKSGVFLSVLGFGSGNVKDSTMEQIADKGNGNYAYIDSESEARKVLVEEAGGTLVTIAKDVKLQVEFNPAEVENYRLIGYENRKLAHADFNDDTKDAGEIGAGHSVTALYEVTPKGGKTTASTDKLKYQDEGKPTKAAESGELMTVKVRYKKPDGNKSKLITTPVTSDDRGIRNTSKDFRFAAAVASFGMILRHSKHAGESSYDEVLKLTNDSIGEDTHGHRKAFVRLVKQAKRLASKDGSTARGQ